MSWAGLANNQTVSKANLQNAIDTSVFAAGASAIAGATNQEVSKQNAVNYIVLDPNYAPFLAKSNNQLIVKSDIKGKVTFNISNSSLDISLTDVQVNGSSITGVSFPVNAGNSATGYYPYFGTATVTLYWSASINGQNLVFTDTASTSTCLNAGTGGTNYDISGADLSGSGDCYINLTDGACS